MLESRLARVLACSLLAGNAVLPPDANAQAVDVLPSEKARMAAEGEGIFLKLSANLSSLPLPGTAAETAAAETAVAETVRAETAAAETGPAVAPLQLAGYAKALVIRSKTPDAAAEPYTLSLNRLRLKMSYSVSPAFQVHVEHDTELRAGNYLHTASFREEQDMPRRQYWSDGSVFADQRQHGYYGTQRVFRAYAKFSGDAIDATIGRQRIPLGAGRLWSALDMLNPVNPVQLERDEYIGVDAALVDYKIGPLSKVSLIYAPDPARMSDRWIGQYRTNVHGADLAFTYGKYAEDHLAGLDIATQLGNAGLRGEWTYTRPQSGAAYRKMVLGFDYVFANSLSISMEAYYNSRSERDMVAQFAKRPLLAYLQPIGKRYLGMVIGYDLTPLVKMTTYVLANRADHSTAVAPTVTWSITENTNMAGGAQFFSGSQESEYGRGDALYFIQMQYFF